MPNIELLNRTLDHIKTNPDTWDQAEWCGTAQCFAGWAITLAGARAGIRPGGDPISVYVDDMPDDLAALVDPDIEWLTVRKAAELALDIVNVTLFDLELEEELTAAGVLFYSGNTLDDLEHYVAELCNKTAEVAAR